MQTTQSYNALNEVVGSCLKDSLSESIQSSDNVQAAEVLHQLCGGQESLAEFPFASFLHSVCSWFVFSSHHVMFSF